MGNTETSSKFDALTADQLTAMQNLESYYEKHSVINFTTNQKQVYEYFFSKIIDYHNTGSELEKKFCNLDTEDHKKCRPSKNCYLFPLEKTTEYELDVNDENKILSRRIFQNKKGYNEDETSSLKELYLEIAKNNIINPNKTIKFPDYWMISDTLKFLQACKFDIKQTIENLNNHLEWRNSYFPMKISEKSIEILSKTGFLYIHGRDRYFRPLIVCRARAYIDNIKTYSYDEWINALVFFMEYVINFLMVPGQVECWNIINDLNGVSIFSLPTDFHKFLKFLQINYRCRLNISYTFGMNKVLDYLWKIIKTFLDKNVEKKIVFISESNKNRILEYILPEQLEKRYGGKAENLFGDDGNIITNKSLFPPMMPDNDNITEDDHKKLITVDDYIKMIKDNRITDISPYINDINDSN